MDKTWKANERAFAAWASEWLREIDPNSTEVFGRNDSRVNADDRTKHSDVDLIHERLAFGQYKGITAELTRQKTGFTRIYEELKSGEALLVSGDIAIMSLWIFKLIFNYLLMLDSGPAPSVRAFAFALDLEVKDIPGKTNTAKIQHKLEQSERYGETKKLFPIVVFRAPYKQQLVAFRISTFDAIHC